MAKKDIERALKDLKAAGYRVSHPPDELVAKTFKIHKDVVADFYRVTTKKDLKIQDAIEEAIRLWIAKNE